MRFIFLILFCVASAHGAVVTNPLAQASNYGTNTARGTNYLMGVTHRGTGAVKLFPLSELALTRDFIARNWADSLLSDVRTETNAAYLSLNGNDSTAILGDPGLPYRQFSNAVTALNALSDAEQKSLYIGAGDFTNTTAISLEPNFKIRGVSRYLSRVLLNHLDSRIEFRDNTLLSDWRLEQLQTNDFSFPIGTDSDNSAWNCVFVNMDFIGGSDCIYTSTQEGSYIPGITDLAQRVTAINCRFRSRWDTVYLTGTDNSVLHYRFFNCDFEAIGPAFAASAGEVSNIKIVGNALAEFHGCRFLSSGATNALSCITVFSGGKIIDNGNEFTKDTNGLLGSFNFTIWNTNASGSSVVISQNSTVTNAANGYGGDGTLTINPPKTISWP